MITSELFQPVSKIEFAERPVFVLLPDVPVRRIDMTVYIQGCTQSEHVEEMR